MEWVLKRYLIQNMSRGIVSWTRGSLIYLDMLYNSYRVSIYYSEEKYTPKKFKKNNIPSNEHDKPYLIFFKLMTFNDNNTWDS